MRKIWTQAGLTALANGQNGIPTKIATMAISSDPYTYDNNSTELTSVVARVPVTSVTSNGNTLKIVANVGKNIGGFYIRCVAFLNDRGDTLIINEYPETYKSGVAESAATEIKVVAHLSVVNGDAESATHTLVVQDSNWITKEELDKEAANAVTSLSNAYKEADKALQTQLSAVVANYVTINTKQTISGNKTLTGATTLTGALTANGGITTSKTDTGTLAVTGSAVFKGTASFAGALTANGGITTNKNINISNGGYLSSTGRYHMYWTSRDNALVRVTTDNGYTAGISWLGSGGNWAIGGYGENLHFTYITNTNYNNKTNTTSVNIKFGADGTATFDKVVASGKLTATDASNDINAVTQAARNNSTKVATTAFVSNGATMPCGTIIAFAGATAPAGWLLCNGQAVSRTTYADLFKLIGTSYGAGNGSSTFNVPDLRGRFLEGANGNLHSKADAGLTNITGSSGRLLCRYDNSIPASGAFTTSSVSGRGSNTDSVGNAVLNFDASSSSAVYGKSTTVQPASVRVNYIVKF